LSNRSKNQKRTGTGLKNRQTLVASTLQGPYPTGILVQFKPALGANLVTIAGSGSAGTRFGFQNRDLGFSFKNWN